MLKMLATEGPASDKPGKIGFDGWGKALQFTKGRNDCSKYSRYDGYLFIHYFINNFVISSWDKRFTVLLT